MKNQENDLARNFGLFIAFTMVTFLVVTFSGFVLSECWGWFISKPFGVIELSLPHAMGLNVLSIFIKPKSKSVKDFNGLWNKAKGSSFTLLFIWGVAYLINLFM
tara:strand:- start:2752 stop:3063 length:312 start_codon:yes stop_codon:yes gene_type:complete